MYFESIGEALLMGGHGGFVWSAYGITFAVLTIALVRPLVSTRSLNATIRLRSARQSNLSEGDS